MWDIPPDNLVKILKVSKALSCACQVCTCNSTLQLRWTLLVLYFVQLGAVKMSILMFYLRIFIGTALRTAIKATTAFVAATSIAFGFAFFFQCTPLKANWTKVNPDGTPLAFTCVHRNGIQYATGAINLATDIWILVLPIPDLIRRRKTFALSSVPLLTETRPQNRKREKAPALPRLLTRNHVSGQLTTPQNPSNYSRHLPSVCVASIMRLTKLAQLAHTDDPTCKSPRPTIHQSLLLLITSPHPTNT